jgi:hypothetical protein
MRSDFVEVVQVIGTPIFYHIGIPLITSFLVVFVKLISKNDEGLKRIKREDFSIGIDLAVTGIILYIIESANQARSMLEKSSDYIEFNNWALLLLVVSLWIVSTMIRFWGWKNISEMTLIFGVIIPNLYGILTLIFVLSMMGG